MCMCVCIGVCAHVCVCVCVASAYICVCQGFPLYSVVPLMWSMVCTNSFDLYPLTLKRYLQRLS